MMWWPWHFDQAGHDAAEECAERELAAGEEANELARLEAHADTSAQKPTSPTLNPPVSNTDRSE